MSSLCIEEGGYIKKTHKAWTGSGIDLGDFLQVGDTVDEEFQMYFLEVLFPACMSKRYIQIGEPFTHNNQGQPMFETLQLKNNEWTYTGIHPTPPEK